MIFQKLSTTQKTSSLKTPPSDTFSTMNSTKHPKAQTTPPSPVIRIACRAILVTPENKILLMKIKNPSSHWIGWITPGGGLNANEDPKAGLKRELLEELGPIPLDIGPCLWKRVHTFPWDNKIIEQRESFYWVPTRFFDVREMHLPDQLEQMAFQEYKWWGLNEIEKSREVFAPLRIDKLITEILERGFPSEPLVIAD